MTPLTPTQRPYTAVSKKFALIILFAVLTYCVQAQPTIGSFSPLSAPAGTTVTITGTNFTGATAVSFGGTPAAAFTVVSATSITAQPAQGTSGNISVTTPAGTASLVGFTFIAPPVITSISPAKATVGTNITITGANFSPTPANNIVYFGIVRASVAAASAGSLTVVVPVGAADQPISVTTNNLTGYSAQSFTLTFPGGVSAFVPSSFASGVKIGAGNQPYAICSGDFDGDGKVDLAIPLSYTGAAAVLRNTSTTGAVSFATAINFTTGSNAYSADAGDLDGDGKLDLVVVNSLAYAFSVLRNTSTPGTISFAPHADFSTGGGQSWTSTIADLDGDGRPDVIVSYYNPQQIAIYHNTSTPGNISFDPAFNLTIPSWSQKVAVGDLDGDGRPDIAVAAGSGKLVSVFKNLSTSGALSFGTRIDVPVSNYPALLTIADLDGDGKNDIVTGIYGAFAVFANTSTGGTISFGPETDLHMASSPSVIWAADLNGDGKPDLSTVRDDDSVFVMKNSSSPGTFAFSTGTTYPAGTFYSASMTIADIDGDGKPDITAAVPNSTLSALFVLLNKVGIPVITSFSPTSGKRGTTVQISGASLTGADTVTFGGAPAGSFVVEGDTGVSVVLGQGGSGSVQVKTPYGAATLAGFTFTGPTVTACTPDSAGTGTTITLTGTNFTGASAVSFGGAAARSFTVVSATQIKAIVDSGATGAVSVITPVDTAQFASFHYFAQPTLTGLSPSATDSGQIVTLTGTHLIGTTGISFGGTPVTAFTVVSDNTITVTVAKGTSGVVQLSGIGGTASLPGFVYTGTTLTSMTPLQGGPGVTITLHGTNFRGTTAVTIGGVAAGAYTVVSDTVISATVGTGASGAVAVTSPQGTATIQGFVYNTTMPVITSFSPASGPVGTTVTIYGGNFDPLAANDIVYFGGVRAAVTNAGANSLTVTVPAGAVYQNISVTTKNLTTIGGAFDVTYPDGGNIDTATFAPATTYGIGSYPYTITNADFDGDGKSDVAAVVVNSSKIAVLRNISQTDTIIFAAPVNYGTGAAPFYIVTTDLNGDGLPDLVTSNQNANTISVLQNTSTVGAISFKPKADFGTGSQPENIAVGDLDGDGRPDLATVNQAAATISIFHNTTPAGGTISFAAKTDIAGEHGPLGIAIGDLDGDGRPDMVECGPPGNLFGIFMNTSTPGTISFAPRVDYSSAIYPQHAVIADVDGDGRADLIIDNSSSNALAIYRNIGTVGHLVLAPPVTVSAASGPASFMLSDINGDGKPDICVAAIASNSAAILQNISSPGNISFSAPVLFQIGPISGALGSWPENITSGDFDGDGKPDLGVTDYGGTQGTTIYILRNKTDSSVQPVILSATPLTAPAGTTITIKGDHFTGTTAVSFGAVAAASYTVVSDTVITAVVGTGATGVITVTTGNGTASLAGFVFTVPPATPKLISFSPASGTTGTLVTIHGNNLAPVTTVTLGGTAAASFTISGDTTIYAIVGAGATGEVAVTDSLGADSLAGFTFIAPPPPPPPPPPATVFRLVSFTGVDQNNLAVLQWSTVNDSSIANYVIQSSTDSVVFGAIGSVTAKHADSADYSFSDLAHNTGLNYYRLKMEDTLGNATYSNIISVQLAMAPSPTLKVTPNPATALVQIAVPPTTNKSNIQLVDMSGALVAVIPVGVGIINVSIDVHLLNPGMYKLIWSDGVHNAYQTLLIIR